MFAALYRTQKTAALALLFIGRSVVFGKTQMKRAAGLRPRRGECFGGTDDVGQRGKVWNRCGSRAAHMGRRHHSACCGCCLCACQYVGERGVSRRQQRADCRRDALYRACGRPRRLDAHKRHSTGAGIAAASLGVITALYNWAILRAFSSIPFALAVLILYLFPLMAAAIVAGLGWEKLAWRTIAAVVVAFAGLALALNVRDSNLNFEGVALAIFAAFGLAIVVAVSGRIFRKVDARPVTLYMAATACVLLLMLCAASGAFTLPNTASGWVGFSVAAVLYGFAMIGFFIAVSIIGPVRASLLSYADAVISAGLGVIVLGQALTPVQILGIAIVILALIGAQRRPKSR